MNLGKQGSTVYVNFAWEVQREFFTNECSSRLSSVIPVCCTAISDNSFRHSKFSFINAHILLEASQECKRECVDNCLNSHPQYNITFE